MTARGTFWLLIACAALLPYDAVSAVHTAAADQAFTASHWLGTDHLGRDVLRRTVAGARIVAESGGLAMLVAGSCGAVLGSVSGWFGGFPAATLRALDAGISAVPSLVLVSLACLAFGGGWATLGVACGVASAPAVAGAIATRLDTLRRDEFVLAARGHGIGDTRILLWHLLWVNTRWLVARELLSTLALVVVTEVTLACLGAFGVPEPTATWGNMIDHALRTGCPNPWSWAAPGLGVIATIWATSLPQERT